MTSDKVLNTNMFLLPPDKRKELALKEQRLKESCRNNLNSPFKTNLQKRLVWYHILITTDHSS